MKMVTEEVEDGNRRSRKEWGSPTKTVKKKKKEGIFFMPTTLGTTLILKAKGRN